ncbi:peptidylprolyl isomerase [Microbacterium sp. NPDC055910]|uniref:peptidylprolyl isomerase n=1 Tax=Microbacterium sp. NPDC055910 TaxID=3345659 RepID=UPI0035E18D62
MRKRLIAVPLLALTLALLAGCSTPASPGATTEPSAPAPAEAQGCEYVENSGAVRDVTAPNAEPAVAGIVDATLQTSAGDIPLTLDADRTPCTVGSFVSLAEQGYYDDSSCHRLTTTGIFVLQCGDPSGTGRGGPGYSYADELDGSETYPAGTIAMANAGPDTNGSQFFLVYEDTALPPSYTVFGELSPEGLEVVQAVAAAGTADGAPDGAPATTVTITGVTLG